MGNFVYAVIGYDAHNSDIIKVFSEKEKAEVFLDTYESDEDYAFVTIRDLEVE